MSSLKIFIIWDQPNLWCYCRCIFRYVRKSARWGEAAVCERDLKKERQRELIYTSPLRGSTLARAGTRCSYTWMPRRNTCSFKYSLWSWRRMGVRFIGEKPMAGRPSYKNTQFLCYTTFMSIICSYLLIYLRFILDSCARFFVLADRSEVHLLPWWSDCLWQQGRFPFSESHSYHEKDRVTYIQLKTHMLTKCLCFSLTWLCR